MKRLIQKFRALKSAMQAGWIAGGCERRHPGDCCISDDEAEEIIPCHRHEKRIAALAAINEANPW